ncbi:hypothetical protein BDZ97DRAFT_1708376 [Flammula alnicola]|nr:hypothetical protein BDZ97DRAFT_1708376 [Flammula alnicola]
MTVVVASDPQRVPELWFQDADVVFRAGQKLFRVHRSILSARSPIFNDMFSVPQPATETQSRTIKDDCTYIYLPDDEMDVYYFFLAIFDASFFEGPPSIPPVDVLIGILRLSDKFEIAFLKRRAISHLNALFPTERSAMLESSKTLHPKFALRDDQTNLMMLEIMALAYTIDTRWIIPGTFLLCVRIPLRILFQHASWKKLTKTFQDSYLVSREAYMEKWESSGQWIASIPTVSCVTPSRCRNKQRPWVKRALTLGPFALSPLANDGPLWDLYSAHFCQECLSQSKSEANAVANANWDGYPGILGLPSWDVLRQEKAAFERG